MNALICCPRCGHQNPARARFCAQCGVNLSLAGAESPTWPHPRQRSRWPAILLLFLVILGGVWLLGAALRPSIVNRHLPVPCEQTAVQVHERRAEAEDEQVITRESTWITEYP